MGAPLVPGDVDERGMKRRKLPTNPAGLVHAIVPELVHADGTPMVHAHGGPPEVVVVALKPFACIECDARFSTSDALQLHSRVHNGHRPFVCPECHQQFVVAGALSVHIRQHRERPHKCQQCDKSYHDVSTLNAHMRTHTGDKPFLCEECGKRFNQSGHLTVHRRMHRNDRPYSCSECNKRFIASSHLVRASVAFCLSVCCLIVLQCLCVRRVSRANARCALVAGSPHAHAHR